jgi:hypothetical protein
MREHKSTKWKTKKKDISSNREKKNFFFYIRSESKIYKCIW